MAFKYINSTDDIFIIRKSLGLSMQQLGDMCGVSRQCISQLESHKIKLTRLMKTCMNLAIEKYIANNTNLFIEKR